MTIHRNSLLQDAMLTFLGTQLGPYTVKGEKHPITLQPAAAINRVFLPAIKDLTIPDEERTLIGRIASQLEAMERLSFRGSNLHTVMGNEGVVNTQNEGTAKALDDVNSLESLPVALDTMQKIAGQQDDAAHRELQQLATELKATFNATVGPYIGSSSPRSTNHVATSTRSGTPPSTGRTSGR